MDAVNTGESAHSVVRSCRVGGMVFELVLCRGVSSLAGMSSKSEQAAREAVAAYHVARLAELVQRVGDAVDHFRAGELDAFEVDQVIFQYSRAAKELWKFCNLADVEFTASLIGDSGPVDWWERGAPRRAVPPLDAVRRPLGLDRVPDSWPEPSSARGHAHRRAERPQRSSLTSPRRVHRRSVPEPRCGGAPRVGEIGTVVGTPR